MMFVSSGQTVVVSNGASISDPQILAGGVLSVGSGGSANSVSVGSGGVLIGAGIENYPVVGSGGTFVLSSGSDENFATVSSAGTILLSSGSYPWEVTLSSGAVVELGSGVVSAVPLSFFEPKTIPDITIMVDSGAMLSAAALVDDTVIVRNGGTVVGLTTSSNSLAFVSGAVIDGEALTGSGSATGSADGLTAFDTTTSSTMFAVGQDYSGPVSGLSMQYINTTMDSQNIALSTDNWFIHTGAGNDAVALHGGTNVVDGGTGSNFLTGGTGTDTFFVDDRGASAAIWSTVANFHSGDAATIWGITPTTAALDWENNQGAAGYTGLTVHATVAGEPTASLTLAGFSKADLTNGKLSVQYGTVDNNSYMYIHAN